MTIVAAVGKNGINNRNDVEIIQTLLNRIPSEQGGPNPILVVDGLIGAKTIQAIEEFQSYHRLPLDGRVEPNGQTLAKLNQITANMSLTQLAKHILESHRIKLAMVHPSGVNDNATARQNIVDTSNGLPAARSSYQNAPGGTIQLHKPILNLIIALAETYTYSISEIAGGSHSQNSRHYLGVAIDINIINNKKVTAAHPDLSSFMQRCRNLGCTEVLGPGSPNHDTHVHAALPRPT